MSTAPRDRSARTDRTDRSDRSDRTDRPERTDRPDRGARTDRPDGTGDPEATLDPTAIRAQPALTSSSGAIWLIVGGLFTAIVLGVLIPMTSLPLGSVAAVAAVTVGVLYLGMVIARLTIPGGRRRLGTLATGMLLIAGVSLVATVIVAFGAGR